MRYLLIVLLTAGCGAEFQPREFPIEVDSRASASPCAPTDAGLACTYVVPGDAIAYSTNGLPNWALWERHPADGFWYSTPQTIGPLPVPDGLYRVDAALSMPAPFPVVLVGLQVWAADDTQPQAAGTKVVGQTYHSEFAGTLSFAAQSPLYGYDAGAIQVAAEFPCASPAWDAGDCGFHGAVFTVTITPILGLPDSGFP